ncbi:hypothetical protein SAMN06272771_5721 [Streptomyces sp. Ag82_O1-12]|uniref:hypothetical protein n=1 Tax=unclassified Streptomyces TaxID=2593676 RepID=UPI000BD6D0FD|nr:MULTISPECIES: hypothetical protein [unclassified Streptomyces]SMQ19249.1 hypothetical protein SAMN06272771_5721 [Streptomyces sp. Ag82_O1-12]SOD48290.1 hypothetical protein SAMN06272727_5724 [Streptomyces sp. Ag82_G6-1]
MLALRLTRGAHPAVQLRRLSVAAASAGTAFLLLCALGYALGHPGSPGTALLRLAWCAAPLAATVYFAVAVARTDPGTKPRAGLSAIGLGPVRMMVVSATTTALSCTLGAMLALLVFLHLRGDLTGMPFDGAAAESLAADRPLPLPGALTLLALVPVGASVAVAVALRPYEARAAGPRAARLYGRFGAYRRTSTRETFGAYGRFGRQIIRPANGRGAEPAATSGAEPATKSGPPAARAGGSAPAAVTGPGVAVSAVADPPVQPPGHMLEGPAQPGAPETVAGDPTGRPSAPYPASPAAAGAHGAAGDPGQWPSPRAAAPDTPGAISPAGALAGHPGRREADSDAPDDSAAPEAALPDTIAAPSGLPWGITVLAAGLAVESYTSRTSPTPPDLSFSGASPGVMAGWALAAVGLALAGPGLTHLCGRLLQAARPGALRLLAGRILMAESVRIGRPLGVVCAVLSAAWAMALLHAPDGLSLGPLTTLGVLLVTGCTTATLLTAAVEARQARAGTTAALLRLGAPATMLRSAAALRAVALLALFGPLTLTVAELAALPLAR